MGKFEVKSEHLVGEIKYFPLHVVQLMVDEQVKQGNPADPSVFAKRKDASRDSGGFDWNKSAIDHLVWAAIILGKEFHRVPKPEVSGKED